jgi:putative transposase
MPRKTRIYLPNVPVHVVQRGHNRDACFFSEEDFQFYKVVLAEGLARYGAQLHAYCLMTNHVHLLLTPLAADSLPLILQHLSRMYVQYINKTYRRRGTLWEVKLLFLHHITAHKLKPIGLYAVASAIRVIHNGD